MTPHSYPSPPRLVAPGGPVSRAVQAMRMAHLLPPLLSEQFDRERAELDVVRSTIKRQIEADLDRIDRCLVILDALDGDADLCADFTTVEPQPDGTLYTLGRSSDDEPGDNGLADRDGMVEQLATYGSLFA